MFSLKRKVNAGALQYVLVIAIIIFILLLSFIQLIQLQNKLAIKSSFYKKAILNTNNGFKGLSNENLDTNISEETSVSKKNWGAFNVVKVTSKFNKEVIEKIGLVGNYSSDRKALYLVDNNTPLVVVGNTKLIGPAYLPKRGIKRGNIAGNSFYGNVLVNGSIRESSSSLPENTTIKSISGFTNSILNKDIKSIELKDGDKLVQSFNKETLIYKDYETIRLQDVSLKGNIIVQSLRKIIVTQETDLQDIILIAPEIEIQSNTKATFQAFATKKITVNKNVSLAYPSYLFVSYKEDRIEEQHGVFFGERSLIKGGVFFLHKEAKERNLNAQIMLETNTKVIGEVYCQGNIELLGTVTGEVYTKNFITKQRGSTYINHIYNGVINSRDLVDEYVGINGNVKHKKVSKWLY